MDAVDARGRAVSDVLRLVEARTKVISASSMMVGTVYAAWRTRHLDWGVLLLMLGGTLAVDVGTAGFNSYFDFVRGVDTVKTDVDRYKVLVHRAIAPSVALWIACAAFGVAALFGLALGVRVGWEVVGVGVVCMAVAFFYSGGPLPIAATPLGEVFAGGCLGSVLVTLSAYVQARAIPPHTLLVGLPSTFLIADILTVNNTCDAEGDFAAGRRTLSIVLGATTSRALVAVLIAVGYGLAFALAAMRVLPALTVVPLAAAGLFAAREIGRMHRRGYTHATKGASMGGISAIFLVYSASILASMLVDAAVRPAAS